MRSSTRSSLPKAGPPFTAPLTPGQAFVLLHVMDDAEVVFDSLEDLVDPVDGAVFLGLIL